MSNNECWPDLSVQHPVGHKGKNKVGLHHLACMPTSTESYLGFHGRQLYHQPVNCGQDSMAFLLWLMLQSNLHLTYLYTLPCFAKFLYRSFRFPSRLAAFMHLLTVWLLITLCD